MKGGWLSNTHDGYNLMIKKELTMRERRKIYEDTICIVAQTHKMVAASPTALKERVVKNMIDKQTDRCVAILTTVLGYHEAVTIDDDGVKHTMLMPEDLDSNYSIEKKKFEEIVQKLPENKELREAMWKSFVKRDQKAKEKFDSFAA